MQTFVLILTMAISFATVFLFGCVGETITEKAGNLNLGIPGIMCAGTAGGCLGVKIAIDLSASATQPSWILLILFGIVFTVIFSALIGGIYALLTVTLRCNQNITGLAITTFGTGFAQFFMDNAVKDREYFGNAGMVIAKCLPFADKLGAVGEIFLSHGILVYLAIAVAIVTAFVLNKTKVGLHLRAVGENPATADAAGINVTRYKYFAIMIGSAIAGLGGFFYIMDFIKGSWENASVIEALGWLCIALVIFTVWKPNLSIFGSILFGALYIAPFVFNVNVSWVKEVIKLLPYIVTIIVLIITSIIDSKDNQPPASLGQNYFREER